MTQTTVDISASVYSGVIDSGAVQIARDLLAGYSDNYLFFQFADGKYCLILSDDISYDDSGNIIVPQSDWYGIQVQKSSHSVAVQESGSASGSYGGFNSSGGYSGTYSGSFSLQAADDPVYSLFYYHDTDGVTIVNSQNYLIYGSLQELPHLIEGGTYYAFAQTAIICIICLFVLVDRIFRHVS